MNRARRLQGLLVGGYLLIQLVAVAPRTAVTDNAWIPKAAVLAVAGAVALPYLVWRAWRPGPLQAAAGFALALGAAGLVSALLAEQPALAVTGELYWGTGALFVLSLAALWAVGSTIRPASTGWLEGFLVAALGVNLVVGVLQTVTDMTRFGVVPRFDRPTGLLANPMHLATLGVGVFLLACRKRGSWWPVLAAAAAATAVLLSGTLAAVAVLAGAGLLAVGAMARHDRARGALLAGATVVGVVLGSVVGAGGVEATATQRTVDADAGGLAGRTETWLSARHALAEGPVVGAGPGRFRAATSPFRTERAARALGAERLPYDAHNLLVEFAVTTGLLGLVLLVGWLAFAFRRASGPLLWAAAGMLAMHLVQPMTVSVTPVAFLLLGAAAVATRTTAPSADADPDEHAAPGGQAEPGEDEEPGEHAAPGGHAEPGEDEEPGEGAEPVAAGPQPGAIPVLVNRLAAAAVVPGLVAAAIVLLVGWHLRQAELDRSSLERTERADRLAPWWPEISYQRARFLVFHGTVERDRELYEDAVAAFAETAARDESNPQWWATLGDAHRSLGVTDPGESRRPYERALAVNPWSARALAGVAAAELDDGNPARALELLERADRVSDSDVVARLRARAEAALDDD